MQAHDLYKSLRREQLRVYLDKECLKDGEDWEEGFVRGLSKSSCYVLLFSRQAMESLVREDRLNDCDNVLLELRLARELQERRGRDHFKVYFLMLGDYTPQQAFHRPFDWFAGHGDHPGYPEASCAAVEAKLTERLKQLDLGKPQTPGGVADNMQWLFKIQGLAMPAGQYSANLSLACSKITNLSDDMKRARTDAGGSFSELLSIIKDAMGFKSRKAAIAPHSVSAADVVSAPAPAEDMVGVEHLP